MTFGLFWILCGVYAGLAMIGLEAWAIRHNTTGPDREVLTLKDIIIGIGLAACPVVNTLVSIGCTIYAFAEIAPKIVLFGGPKQ
jgi:hypothetical protein